MDGAFAKHIAPWTGQQVRFTTAGSVDDGKSTLIGRILLDAGALMRDQRAALGDGDDMDLAALTDGLEAERAQGITIDVAYRYFATPSANFVIADAPGHEQYTRNMVTAASASDIAVLVIDASRIENAQLKPQTRRHAAIAALMGLDVIVAVNKMDLIGWSQETFDDICASFRDVAGSLGLSHVNFVPVSAKRGDNVVHPGEAAWYTGPTLIQLLQTVRPRATRADGPLRFPIQVVLRDGDARLYAGRIESGAVRPGDTVRTGPHASSSVKSVRNAGKAIPFAEAGASIAIELDDERDLSAGDVIADPAVRYTGQLVADLCWLDEWASTPGRKYRLRQGSKETQARIEEVRFVRNISDFTQRTGVTALNMNDIASVRVSTRDPVLADLFAEASSGAFVLIDPDTNQTCAAGMIREVRA
ncbi:MAG: GTP-binding protein [Terricaulis sp.]